MTHAQRTETRRRLLAQRARLLALHRSTEAQEDELRATREPDWEDAAAAATATTVLAVLDEATRAEVMAIDAALERLRTNRYGRCVECGARIPPPRLRATPHVAQCVTCVGLHERHV